MIGNKRIYDLVFSMGGACSCAQVLIDANLRQFSSPFDWLFGSNFKDRCEILSSEFERFLEQKDLEFSYSERSIFCDAYYNKYNKLTFNHDFAASRSLDDTFPSVKEKYERRINRLLAKIHQSHRILLVYVTTPDTKEPEPNMDIIAGYEKIKKKYPNKEIDLLYFINDPSLKPKKEIKKENLNGNIVKIIANYKDVKKMAIPYAVDTSVIVKILSGYRLNISYIQRIKIFMVKSMVNCIPLKKIRTKLRRIYHV